MQDTYLRKSISNGNPREQALIRRWWLEEHHGSGDLVWEYYIDGYYIDAVLFPCFGVSGVEHPGSKTNDRFPLKGRKVILCEAKLNLTPELIGQAIVYSKLAIKKGAEIQSLNLFCEVAKTEILEVAEDMNFEVIIHSPQPVAGGDATRWRS